MRESPASREEPAQGESIAEGDPYVPKLDSTRLVACFAGVAAAALLALPASSPLAPSVARAAVVGNCTPGADWGTSRPDLASRVVQLVNSHRAGKGLAALKVSPTLTSSAVWKSRHMAKYAYLAHNDPAPPVARTVAQRLAACSYPGSGWGENIAYGYSTPEAVMQAWLGSAGHRANIENSSFKVIGVGAAASSSGTLYWTQDFGTFDDSGSAPPPPPPPGPPPPPPPTTTVTAFPSSVTIQAGSYRSGGVGGLSADDSSYLQVNSSATSRSAAWYGRFTLAPNTLRNLRVTYRGSSSATCTQSLSIWNWTRGLWATLDTRSVGGAEVEASAAPTGTLSEYVSGTTGNGDVAVRVSCARSDTLGFYTSGDLMRIVYDR